MVEMGSISNPATDMTIQFMGTGVNIKVTWSNLIVLLKGSAILKSGQLRFTLVFAISILVAPFITGCSSESNTAAQEESVCTTFSSVISAAEELEGGMMEMNRLTGGSETQISPTPFDMGSLGIDYALANAGIKYERGPFNRGAVEKFLEVAGECLSDDTYQYLSNYIN